MLYVVFFQGKVIEPLRDFHKDEVRELGIQLGLPRDLVSRHPFPGPGLAIRVICGDVPYSKDDYADTKLILTTIVNYSESLARVSNKLCTSYKIEHTRRKAY